MPERPFIRFDRHIVFLRPQAGDEAMVVIFDDLESEKPARFQWWLHSLEQMKVDDRSGTVSVQRGAARLRVQFLLPDSLRFEQTSGFPTATQGNYPTQWHLAANADSPSARRQFVTVLLPYREGSEQSLPSARLLEGKNCRAVELRSDRARRVVLLREAAPGAMQAAGVRSDAALYAARFGR